MSNSRDKVAFDPADEAARLLSRIGYIVLALGGPTAEALSPRAIFFIFPFGVAMLAAAAWLSPDNDPTRRLSEKFTSPLAIAFYAWFGWAVVSLLWTPYPGAGVQHLLKMASTVLSASFVVAISRERMRAPDLYLFPIGVLGGMVAILALAYAARRGFIESDGRIERSGLAMLLALFPAMAGLHARGRDGLGRLLMILSICFTFAIGSPVGAAAMIVGFGALSFALSDVKRTAKDLAVVVAIIVLGAPILAALAPMLAHVLFASKLASIGQPFAMLAVAADFTLHEMFRLLTGHGIDTVSRGVADGVLPALTPRSALFETWFELGVLGAIFGSATVAISFMGLARTGEGVAPYLIGGLACATTMGLLGQGFSQMSWVTLIAISMISAGAAVRSQYRTERPKAPTS